MTEYIRKRIYLGENIRIYSNIRIFGIHWALDWSIIKAIEFLPCSIFVVHVSISEVRAIAVYFWGTPHAVGGVLGFFQDVVQYCTVQYSTVA